MKINQLFTTACNGRSKPSIYGSQVVVSLQSADKDATRSAFLHDDCACSSCSTQATIIKIIDTYIYVSGEHSEASRSLWIRYNYAQRIKYYNARYTYTAEVR